MLASHFSLTISKSKECSEKRQKNNKPSPKHIKMQQLQLNILHLGFTSEVMPSVTSVHTHTYILYPLPRPDISRDN